jgi:site-specific DNA recombinase
MRHKQPIRWCAVYTRKSSEEGLEQDFNSLDAQREAGGAYVESQRHEGWRPLTAHYDDGGYSGGTLDRPALQRLLAVVCVKFSKRSWRERASLSSTAKDHPFVPT